MSVSVTVRAGVVNFSPTVNSSKNLGKVLQRVEHHDGYLSVSGAANTILVPRNRFVYEPELLRVQLNDSKTRWIIQEKLKRRNCRELLWRPCRQVDLDSGTIR